MPTIPADDATQAAIAELLAEQDAAWARGDAEGFAAHVLPDVVFTNVVGMFSVGRAPFVAQHAHIFATFYRGSTLRQSLVRLTLVRSDVAIVDTLTAVSGFAGLPPGAAAADGVLQTRLEQVLVRDAGAWRVAAFHNVAVQPGLPPGPPPAA